MRPNRERTGLVRYPDRILDRETLLRNEGTAIATEVSHERVSKIVHHTSRDQCARDVRTPDRSTVRLQEDFIQRDRDVEAIELLHDLLRADVPQCAQIAETFPQSLEMRE